MIIKSSILAILIFFSFNVFSQDTSSVLLSELKGEYIGKICKGLANGSGFAKGIDTYEGKFKKGLPHGDGKYIWADGSIYVGGWYKGKQSGEGTYICKTKNADTVLVGIWKKGLYIGPKSVSPIVKRYYNIDGFTFSKSIGTLNRVLINFTQNGTTNIKIENLMLTASNGTRTSSGNLIGYDNVTFPVTITARYDTYNKLGTKQVNAFFEIIVYETGDWVVVVKN